MNRIIVSLTIIVIGAGALARAQTARGTARGSQGPNVSSAAAPLEARVVKGLPYSAEVERESIQTLADGNRIIQRSTGRVYRDSQGRVRREDDGPSGVVSVTISDPGAGTGLTLDPARKTVRETKGAPLLALNDFLARQYWIQMPGQTNAGAGTLVFSRGTGSESRGVAGGDRVEDKLDGKLIEGVIATGIRRTTTIAKGAIGNEQAIKIVSEEWTSPDLQVLVLTDVNDPRTGRSTYRLLKITRVEPDATLFQAPPDYTPAGAAGARGRGRGGE